MSIPIKYINATGHTDFQVAVFTQNYSPNTQEPVFVPWNLFHGCSHTVSFHYPVDLAVGASFTAEDQSISCGPFRAELGSTWEITQAAEDSIPAVFKTIHGSKPNHNGSIVIRNAAGHPFDLGIYKSGKLLVVQKGVNVGDQADFMLKPKLIFGVVHNMYVGDVFKSLEQTTVIHHDEFDLDNYAHGLQVILTFGEGPGGQYKFSGKSL